MLQWLRRVKSKRSFRILAMIGVAILSVGLIGSFAIWSIPQFSSSSQANNQTPVDPSVQYEEMENRISELEASLSENKEDPKVLEKLGNAYYDLGFQMFMDGADSALALAKLNSALENYEAALELDPENVPLMLQAASTAASIGNTEKGEELYKQAVELEPDSAEAKMYYGNFLLYAKSDFQGAREQLEKALELNPEEDIKSSIDALLEQADQLEAAQKEADSEKDKGEE
ncbi:MAG TPA: tetratricopeptide repeat protein [Clostridia bacterium]|jgi:cytochrome c-type biogenesis protein CcmH/NrfG|nr:tetratricopeptide repeat protein [Clostridia bacterium]